MADIDESKQSEVVRITGGDEAHQAAVEEISGKKRLLVDSNISSVNVPLGQDPLPDWAFRVRNAGLLNDTFRVQIAGTAADPSSPDRDLPAVDVTTTITASEAGDEIAAADLIVADLNSDSNFQNAFLKAARVTDRAIVHISSEKLSMPGEFYERPNGSDAQVTTTGSAVAENVSPGASDKLISRPKQVSLARDPDNPHVLGIQGIFGTVAVNPGAIPDRFEIELKNAGSGAMSVDGSVTPVIFEFPAIAGFDQFVTSILIHGLDNGIKLQNFFGLNSPLTNGLTWDILSEEAPFAFPTIKSTREVKRFASIGGWELDVEASADDALARKDFGLTPLVIRATGTFVSGDGYIRCIVNDNLTQVNDLRVICRGFRRAV